ncbi:MAG: hypothetical protein WC341_00400 [Bacteroidales bacterium]|jgi:hypothetical protein
MSEKQKTLALTLDDEPVALIISRATARAGVQRYLLASRGKEFNDKNPESDLATQILRVTLYPDLMSTTEIMNGLPKDLSFEDFIELPESFVNQWGDTVYQLNPDWRPELPEKELGDAINKSKNASKRHSSKEQKTIAPIQPMKN